ncbi:PAS domain-containing protein [Acidovorax sp. 100]|uniref:PAS domain-containing protein n=1 Tax=Acidovorax sp. 100 TaxID=2135635 RepID=UPI000EFA29B8|nr:PAS domain-containing protein [Acidovorax sp. 100]
MNSGSAAAASAILAHLARRIPIFVWLKDEQSRLLAANTAYARVARVASTAELKGRTEFDFFPKDLAETYVADDKAFIASGAAHYVKELYVDEHGELRWIEVCKSPLHQHGKVVARVPHPGRKLCRRDCTF